MEDATQLLVDALEELVNDEEVRKAAFEGKPDGNPISLGPRVKNPDAWVEDMVTGATNRAQRWLDNSLSPKKNPKEAALNAKTKYENNMRRSLDEGSWEAGVKTYDEGAREDVIRQGGTSAFTEGVRRHRPKAVSKIKKLHPLITAVALASDKLPVGTEAEREAKMITNLRMMRDVGRIMRGQKTGMPSPT